MSIGRTTDEKLRSLDEILDEPTSTEAAAILEKALAAKQNAVVQRAAHIIASAELRTHDEALCAAFPRFLPNSKKVDKGCLAKEAIAAALLDSDSRAEEVFLAGIRHIQMEPVWGGQEDTAVDLRIACALGLVNTHSPDTLRELGDLLADAEPMARAGAARALGLSGRVQEGVPLLRLRCRIGDEDPRVLQAAFNALLELAPDEELPFVSEFLEADDPELAEAAALALGESRNPGAFPALRRVLEETVTPETQSALSVAIAMLRFDDAWKYLLEAIRDESEGRALAAVKALAYFRHDPSLAEQIDASLEERDDSRFTALAREELA